MICFRDKTFCNSKDCKSFKGCISALTDEVKKDAEKWWGGKDAPIAVYGGNPACFEERLNAK